MRSIVKKSSFKPQMFIDTKLCPWHIQGLGPRHVSSIITKYGVCKTPEKEDPRPGYTNYMALHPHW